MSRREAHRAIAATGVKGGVGTTAVAMTASTVVRRHGRRGLLVDLTGDMATVLDAELAGAPGVAELLDGGDGRRLDDLVIDLAEPFQLLPRGNGPLHGTDDAWHSLWEAVAGHDSQAFIDAGRVEHADPMLQHSGARRLLVATLCYQSYSRAVDLLGNGKPASAAHSDTALVMVDGGHMSLDAFIRDLDRAPAALIPRTSEIGRWMDSGLILDRGLAAAGPLEHLVAPDFTAEPTPDLEDPDAAIGL